MGAEGQQPLLVELLGPIHVWCGGMQLQLREPRLQGVLGILASRSSSVVSRGELIDAMWGEQAPSRSENAVHVYVARLRRILEPDRARRAPARLLIWTGAGYLLRLEPGDLDVRTFEAHRDHAHQARAAGDLDKALRRYDAALDLWRGTPWSGVPGPFAQAERTRLSELWLMVTEDRAETMLALGRHGDIVAELITLVAAHPLRERLRALLMLALYRSGRQAEALQAFRDARGVLVDKLGIEPGAELQQLHQRILGADPTVTAPSRGIPVPRQLPADVANFTNRERHLADLHAVLDGRVAGSPAGICAIDGTAGVGKTALAVHFGHRVADRFPDGQLYVDLHGYAPGRPMSSREALGRFLRSLGLRPEQIPTDEDERAATYRSLLAGKRMLVLLDNARNAQQVRPLLPGGPDCLVVITSRAALATVDGAHHVNLDVLAEQQALSLLARLVGTDRIAREPESAADLVRLCVRLPLALCIAGARLATRPHWSIGSLAERLGDEQHRLDELRSADRAVRASFAVSHNALRTSDDPVDQTAASLFQRLGTVDWVEMSVPIAAALLDLPQPQAHAALECLVDNRLLDSPTPGRYQCHDLLHLYAYDLADQHEDPPGRLAALLRALDCYRTAAERATRLLDPTATRRIRAYSARDRTDGFVLRNYADVTAWVDAEHANLLVAAQQAANAPDPAPALAVGLTDALFRPLRIRSRWHDIVALRELAASTAHRLGDLHGEALAREDLAQAYRRAGHVDLAITAGRQALMMWRELGDRHGEQACLHIVGNAYRARQQPGEAISCLEQGLAINRDIGYRHGEASILDSLGMAYQHLHRLDDAITYHQRSIEISNDIGNRPGEAVALCNLGWANYRAGHADQAIANYEQSLAILHDLGDRYSEAEALWGLGQTHHTLGHHDQAHTYWHRSIAILHELGELTDEYAHTLRQQPIPETPALIRRHI